MFTTSERDHHKEQCFCQDHDVSYRIIENYRSILDRTQQLISTWNIFEKNGKVNFTRGTQYRKGTDALVIRLNHICLINPWYKYINVNKHLEAIGKNNQGHKVFEIVLLECNCLMNWNEYELAIIQCPCLEQRKTHCSYCRLILTATEQSKRLFKNVKQQTNISLSSDFFNDEVMIYDTCHSQSGPHPHQRTVQIQVNSEPIPESTEQLMPQRLHNDVDHFSSDSQSIFLPYDNELQPSSSQSHHAIESEEDILLHEDTCTGIITHQNRETQTKLYAILLPESPLYEMKPAKTEARTSSNVTRICQVNTLSYLIKTNDNQADLPPMDYLSSTSFLQAKSPLINLSRKIEHEPLINVPIIQLEEEEEPETPLLTPSPLKCINACDSVDVDQPNTSITSFLSDNDTISRSISSDQQNKEDDLLTSTINAHKEHQQYRQSLDYSNTHIINSNNNCEEMSCHLSKLFRWSNKHYRMLSRKRRRMRNKKLAYGFLQRLYRRKETKVVELEYHLPTPEMNPIQHVTSSNRRQKSIINLHFNDSDMTPQYKSADHIIIARATKNSVAFKQLQALVNNDETLLEQLIHSQLTLTCNHNIKSVCILLDNHKQSDQYRTSFLHYIYTTLSNTLKMIIEKESVQVTCMNLAFFNNSVCDIINMRRLRLIDTGRKIILLPSCEVPLQTSADVNMAINRLSTNMSFAHQIFIINFSHERSSLSGSFFFLQLAPICSIRPTGLLTNLNSSTYSVLNLIRQFNTGQLFNHNTTKRYLMNDCSLNRLLKSYLFASQQTMTVITVKPRERIAD